MWQMNKLQLQFDKLLTVGLSGDARCIANMQAVAGLLHTIADPSGQDKAECPWPKLAQ